MSSLIHALRKQIHPRAAWSAWGPDKPVRASDIILGVMLVMGIVVLVAHMLTYFFSA